MSRVFQTNGFAPPLALKRVTCQDGTPTFVEAKRCNDPRARREVIGQMLEYVANGRAYWTTEELKAAFLYTYGSQGEAESRLKEFRGQGEEALDAFLSAFLNKLQSGTVRLVFFLEDSSYELRTLAEFLNEQLKSAEVFVVEARQYQLSSESSTVIVPHVVGFTEATRVAKELVRAEEKKTQTERGESAFWKQLLDELPDQAAAVREFIDELQSLPNANVTWIASAVFQLPNVLPGRGLFGIRRPAHLEIYLYYWNPENYPDLGPEQIEVRERFVTGLKELGLLKAVHAPGYPSISPAVWIPKRKELIALIRNLVKAENDKQPPTMSPILDEEHESSRLVIR